MLLAIFLLAVATTVGSETDVLVQIGTGKMLCSNPDPATKTCSTIDTYTVEENGTLIDTGEVLFSPDQPVTLETSSVVHIENGAVCGVVDVADLQKGRVRVNGTLLPADRNALVVNKIIDKLKPLTGRKACEALRIEAGHLMKYGQVERIDINLPGKPVSWIAGADGYRVAPR